MRKIYCDICGKLIEKSDDEQFYHNGQPRDFSYLPAIKVCPEVEDLCYHCYCIGLHLKVSEMVKNEWIKQSAMNDNPGQKNNK